MLAALILSVSVAHAQTAQPPIWRVGYKWAFHQVSNMQPTESDWTREVTETLPEGRFSVRTDTGRMLVFDGETNSLDPRGAEYSWKRFDFPLSVGKRWTHERRIGGGPGAGDEGFEKATWEVKAYEKVTVPAGTFDCFRVEGVIWQSQSDRIYARREGHQDFTYWYCPTVKWIARAKSHRAASHGSNYVDTEFVLMSFTANP